MLRKIRIFAATFCFVLITLLFLDFTGTIHAWFGWLAKIQFWPALLALNVGVVVGLIILTLLLGRVYCSVICPLGVLQDIISWFASKRKKYRFSYSPALKWVRYGTLVIFILACIAGIGSLVALISLFRKGAVKHLDSCSLNTAYRVCFLSSLSASCNSLLTFCFS